MFGAMNDNPRSDVYFSPIPADVPGFGRKLVLNSKSDG